MKGCDVMANEYPNIYYEELSKLIISNPSLSLKQGEVCFYDGKAKSYQVVTEIKATPKKKTSFFWTPWFSGVKRKTETEISQETKTEYYKGQFYITNMRLVFKCAVDAFNLLIPNVTSVNQHKDGIRVVSGNRYFDVMTKDVDSILRIFDLMNKAQSEPATSKATNEQHETELQNNSSRNDDYCIAAFVHYCAFSGKPLLKKNDAYPSYLKYDFGINNPSKYHQKVIDEGYLEEAPAANSLKHFKVDQLKQILTSNGLSDKGKKDELIQRIVSNVNLDTLPLDKVYIPSEKGIEYLNKYDYLFKVKKYDIAVSEFEHYQQESKGGLTNDIIWRILNDKFNEHSLARDFGLARNVLLKKAIFLLDEGKETDSLSYYILVFYYDMSGYGNNNTRDSKKDLMFAPGIVKAIYDRKEYYKPEMITRCFEKYQLQSHYCTNSSFEKMIKKIFNDETIDVSSI